MSDLSESSSFLDRLNSGDEEAINEMVDRYLDRLRALADRKMGKHIGSEPQSLADSVMASVICGIKKRGYTFRDSRRLWSLLVTITLHKIAKRAAKRKREGAVPPDFNSLLASGPTAEAVTIFEDLIETALEGLDPSYRAILLTYMAGSNRTEISNELGFSYAIVKTRLKRVLDRLGRLY